MKTLIPLKLFCLCIVTCFSAFVVAKERPIPHSIIIITSNQKPLSNVAYVKHLLHQSNGSLSIYNLDAVSDIEQRFSESLSANEDEARDQFEQRMMSYGTQRFEQELVDAYQGLFYALVHGVDRYPVIIFNQSEAVYGVTDIRASLVKYQQWRQDNE